MTTPGSTREVQRSAPPRKRRSFVPKFALAVPSSLWYIGFFVVPLVFIVVYSFGSKIQGTAGDVDTSHPTLARYGDALSSTFFQVLKQPCERRSSAPPSAS